MRWWQREGKNGLILQIICSALVNFGPWYLEYQLTSSSNIHCISQNVYAGISWKNSSGAATLSIPKILENDNLVIFLTFTWRCFQILLLLLLFGSARWHTEKVVFLHPIIVISTYSALVNSESVLGLFRVPVLASVSPGFTRTGKHWSKTWQVFISPQDS